MDGECGWMDGRVDGWMDVCRQQTIKDRVYLSMGLLLCWSLLWSVDGIQTFGHKTFGHKTFGHKTFGHKTFGHKTFGHKVAGTTFGHSMTSSCCNNQAHLVLESESA